MTPTHVILPGHGYYDITEFPLGGCFRRAGTDPIPFESTWEFYNQRGYRPHAVGVLANGRRIAVDESSFESLIGDTP